MAKYKTLQNFYASKEWIQLRFNLISQRENKCCRCGEIKTSSKLIGHHIIRLTLDNVNDSSISLNSDNIEIVCWDCHNREHHSITKKQKVFIVYGPPCSGKNSYVNQVFEHGDLLIDIDRVWSCISNQNLYDKPTELNPISFHLWDELIDCVKVRKGSWNNCYIVSGLPNKIKRERLANELSAELIYIERTKEECFDNLMKDEEKSKRYEEWKEYITKWFDEYIE